MEQKATPALSALVATSQNVQLHYATQSQTSSGSEISIVSSAERQRRCGQAQVERELAEHRVNELREAKEQARVDREQAKELARVERELIKARAAEAQSRVDLSTGSRADLSSGSQTGSIGRSPTTYDASGGPPAQGGQGTAPNDTFSDCSSCAPTTTVSVEVPTTDSALPPQGGAHPTNFDSALLPQGGAHPTPDTSALPPQGGVPRPTTDRALPPQGGVPSPTTYDASGGPPPQGRMPTSNTFVVKQIVVNNERPPPPPLPPEQEEATLTQQNHPGGDGGGGDGGGGASTGSTNPRLPGGQHHQQARRRCVLHHRVDSQTSISLIYSTYRVHFHVVVHYHDSFGLACLVTPIAEVAWRAPNEDGECITDETNEPLSEGCNFHLGISGIY